MTPYDPGVTNAELLRGALLRAGFHEAGVIQSSAYTEPHFREWLAAGMHGGMHWMHEHGAVRADLAAAFPKTRSIAIALVEYGTDLPDSAAMNSRVATYARGHDYHLVVKDMLNAAAAEIETARPGSSIRALVDTSPINEKRCAELAGLGFIGKHTNLIHPARGSWSFLALLLTALEVEVTPVVQPERCGQCTACLDVCPTKAFPQPFVLDARRCISYLTIEHRGIIPRELRPLMGGWIFGCDLCLAACPWNRFARHPVSVAFRPREVLASAELESLLGLSDLAFRRMFDGSPLLRTGWIHFVRNCLIAAGNSGDRKLVPAVTHILKRHDGVLRVHALWALARLDDDAARLWCNTMLPTTTHTDVCAEMRAILGTA